MANVVRPGEGLNIDPASARCDRRSADYSAQAHETTPIGLSARHHSRHIFVGVNRGAAFSRPCWPPSCSEIALALVGDKGRAKVTQTRSERAVAGRVQARRDHHGSSPRSVRSERWPSPLANMESAHSQTSPGLVATFYLRPALLLRAGRSRARRRKACRLLHLQADRLSQGRAVAGAWDLFQRKRPTLAHREDWNEPAVPSRSSGWSSRRAIRSTSTAPTST